MSYWMAVRRRLAAAALAAIDIAALAIAYTGNMTDEIVTMGDGRQYRLLTLTSSGTLTIPTEVKADVWLCGGGANGMAAWTGGPTGGYGGSGGFITQALNQTIKNITSVVGAAAGNSSITGDISLSALCGNSPDMYNPNTTAIYGASGGGGRGTYYWDSNQPGLKGAGVSTYPFGDTTYFSGKPHSAGGGGGTCSHYTSSGNEYVGAGGNGGTNGGDGGIGLTAGSHGSSGGTGGALGGGTGASRYLGSKGTNATFYGSGGGGGSVRDDEDDVSSTYPATSGYQGVIYVRIPLKPLTINDFQLVEYIQSTGTQYVNTGINPTQNTKMELDVAFLGSSGTNVAGVRNTSADTTNRFGIISFGSANKLGAFFGAASVQGAAFDQARHSYALDSSALIMDGTSYAVTSGGTFACTYPITLGAWNNGANGVECNSARIYSCKLYGNGEMVRNLVPCYRKSDNVPGLWDKVENRFFMNAGSGSFTVGQNV